MGTCCEKQSIKPLKSTEVQIDDESRSQSRVTKVPQTQMTSQQLDNEEKSIAYSEEGEQTPSILPQPDKPIVMDRSNSFKQSIRKLGSVDNMQCYPFLCVNQPDQSFVVFIKNDEPQVQSISYLLQKANQYLKEKFQSQFTYLQLQIPLLDDTRTISYYEDCMPFYFHLQQHYESLININVKFLETGKTDTFELYPSNTILDLKQLIFKTKNLKLDNHNLFLDPINFFLDDTQISLVINYNDESMPILVNKQPTEPLQSILPMAIDPNAAGTDATLLLQQQINKKVVTNIIDYNKNFSEHGKITNGICIIGVCDNKSCPTFQSNSFFNFGFGYIDLIIDQSSIICNKCNNPMAQITHWGATNCEYLQLGTEKEGVNIKRKQINHSWNKIRNKFIYYSFDEDNKNQILYQVCAKEIQKRNEYGLELENTAVCGICQTLLSSGAAITLPCNHSFHQICHSMLPILISGECAICV